jgi:hypothetical protein
VVCGLCSKSSMSLLPNWIRFLSTVHPGNQRNLYFWKIAVDRTL